MICHGYANCCVCDRCTDRSARFDLYFEEGHPDSAIVACEESAEYFKTPWKFDNGTPPRRLKEEA